MHAVCHSMMLQYIHHPKHIPFVGGKDTPNPLFKYFKMYNIISLTIVIPLCS